MDERQVPRSSRRRRSQNISCRAHSRWRHAARPRREFRRDLLLAAKKATSSARRHPLLREWHPHVRRSSKPFPRLRNRSAGPRGRRSADASRNVRHQERTRSDRRDRGAKQKRSPGRRSDANRRPSPSLWLRWLHNLRPLLPLEQEKEQPSTLPRFSPGRAEPDLAPLEKYSGFALGDSVLAPAPAFAHSVGSPFLFSPPVLSPVPCRQQPCRRDPLFSRHERDMHRRRAPHPSAGFLLSPAKGLPVRPLFLTHQFAAFSGPSNPSAWSRRKACRSWKKALTDSAAPPAKPQALSWMQEGKERRAPDSLRF